MKSTVNGIEAAGCHPSSSPIPSPPLLLPAAVPKPPCALATTARHHPLRARCHLHRRSSHMTPPNTTTAPPCCCHHQAMATTPSRSHLHQSKHQPAIIFFHLPVAASPMLSAMAAAARILSSPMDATSQGHLFLFSTSSFPLLPTRTDPKLSASLLPHRLPIFFSLPATMNIICPIAGYPFPSPSSAHCSEPQAHLCSSSIQISPSFPLLPPLCALCSPWHPAIHRASALRNPSPSSPLCQANIPTSRSISAMIQAVKHLAGLRPIQQPSNPCGRWSSCKGSR